MSWLVRKKAALKLELDSMQTIQCENQESVSGTAMETKVKGNYSASARKHTYECLDSQVPVDKTSDLLCFVAYNICKQTLKDLPNTSTCISLGSL